ncbi:MAG: phage holin family protein [Oligoflexia bacterium]|nr:phage holin family protein [Oligoflexia bacterium]
MDHGLIITLVQWAVSAIALMATSYFLSGFQVGGFLSALVISVVIGFANFFIKPILVLLTLPLNIITLGLFMIIINGVILRFCAAVLPNFSIKNWSTAFLGAVVLAILNAILHTIIV